MAKKGRPVGTNKEEMKKREIKSKAIDKDMANALVKVYTEEALGTMVTIMCESESENVRKDCAKYILDWSVKVLDEEDQDLYKEFLEWKAANAKKDKNAKVLKIG